MFLPLTLNPLNSTSQILIFPILWIFFFQYASQPDINLTTCPLLSFAKTLADIFFHIFIFCEDLERKSHLKDGLKQQSISTKLKY